MADIKRKMSFFVFPVLNRKNDQLLAVTERLEPEEVLVYDLWAFLELRLTPHPLGHMVCSCKGLTVGTFALNLCRIFLHPDTCLFVVSA